jgi:hypothetical protein
MKTYGGGGLWKYRSTILDYIIRWRWVISFPPFPAASPPGKDPGTNWTGGWIAPRAGLDVMEKRKTLPLSGNEPLLPSSWPLQSCDEGGELWRLWEQTVYVCFKIYFSWCGRSEWSVGNSLPEYAVSIRTEPVTPLRPCSSVSPCRGAFLRFFFPVFTSTILIYQRLFNLSTGY